MQLQMCSNHPRWFATLADGNRGHIRYCRNRFPTELLGTMPRSISRCPSRSLPVRSHFSYNRRRSLFEVRACRSLMSASTSLKPTNFPASSAKTSRRASSARLNEP